VAEPQNTADKLPTRQNFEELVRRANGGDQKAIQELRSLLQNTPELWEGLGDLSNHSQHGLIMAIGGKNQLLLAAIQRKVEQLQKDLLGPDPSALERLLVGRVIVSYLEVEYLTVKYPADGAANLATSRFAVAAKSGAQRRFDASIKSLTLVRERLPAIERANRELRKDRRKVIRLPSRVSA
jgi:hypothetical protein